MARDQPTFAKARQRANLVFISPRAESLLRGTPIRVFSSLSAALKQIKKELGEEDEQAVETKEYDKKIADAHMSPEGEKEARRELDRMKTMPPAAAEYHVIKTYLDWLVELPWSKTTEDDLTIARARQILDEDH